MSRDLILDWALTWLFLAQLALIFWNQRTLARPLARLWDDDAPLVSVLVPARNEEDTIAQLPAVAPRPGLPPAGDHRPR